jgi:hypothetical protein
MMTELYSSRLKSSLYDDDSDLYESDNVTEDSFKEISKNAKVHKQNLVKTTMY